MVRRRLLSRRLDSDKGNIFLRSSARYHRSFDGMENPIVTIRRAEENKYFLANWGTRAKKKGEKGKKIFRLMSHLVEHTTFLNLYSHFHLH